MARHSSASTSAPSGALRQRRRGRAFSPELAATLRCLLAILEQLCPDLRRWLALNLAVLTVAMLQLWRGARSGNGGLTLAALSRAMPLQEAEKARSKRLYRLLRNHHLEGSALTPLLIRLALGTQVQGWIPVVVDQTTIRGTPTLMAGIQLAGRILPVAFTCFRYEQLRHSQNALEESLLLLVVACLPWGCRPLLVMDRGYARVSLLIRLRQLNIPYLIRGRGQTVVRRADKSMALNRLPHRKGQAIRYRRVAYQQQRREPVDVVIFHDSQFQEPWYLLVPPDSKALLPTAQVVQLYRQRMHIELTFRDWKTHLGVRGLRLEVDIAPRLERLLLVLTVAYVLAVLLGCCRTAQTVRADCEVLRSSPRHGTRRRLSALSIGILLLSLTRFATLARRALAHLLQALRRGCPAAQLAPCPP